MTEFAEALRARPSSVLIRGTEDVARDTEAIKLRLLANPHVLASLKGFCMTTRRTRQGYEYELSELLYAEGGGPVWCVHDRLEWQTAFAYMLLTHYRTIRLCVDNRTRFLDIDRLSDCVEDGLAACGHELELSQLSSHSMSSLSLFAGELLVLSFRFDYMNTHKQFNDLKALGEELSRSVFSGRESLFSALSGRMSDEEKTRVLARWFSEHVRYRNKGLKSDHSAYSLLSEGEGVCQGIAALAIVILENAGVPTRYVKGEGRGGKTWERHGWNLVRLGGEWKHCDFTFALSCRRGRYINRNAEDMAEDHRFEGERYTNEASEAILRQKKLYRGSVFGFLPGKRLFSVNGAIMEYDEGIPLVRQNGTAYLRLFKLLAFLGCSYELLGDRSCVRIFSDGRMCDLPTDSLCRIDGHDHIRFDDLGRFGWFAFEEKHGVYRITFR